jgi:hypothetical protein
MPPPAGPPPPDDPAQDAWDDDPWERDDWKRDPWKEADWGKPAAPPGEVPPGRKRGGLGAWNASMMEAGPYLSLGLQSAFAMAFFVGLGYLVDGWLGSRPWGIIVGAVLGMVGVMMLLVRLSNRANAETAARRRAQKGQPD